MANLVGLFPYNNMVVRYVDEFGDMVIAESYINDAVYCVRVQCRNFDISLRFIDKLRLPFRMILDACGSYSYDIESCNRISDEYDRYIPILEKHISSALSANALPINLA